MRDCKIGDIEDVLDRAEKMYRGIKVMRDCGFPSGEFAWEECYLAFRKARKARPSNGASPEYEQLKEQACLRLAVYLATFGMYRRSSFISGLDASAHMPVVELLLEKKYDALQSSLGLLLQAVGPCLTPSGTKPYLFWLMRCVLTAARLKARCSYSKSSMGDSRVNWQRKL